jgi:magnesium transporter
VRRAGADYLLYALLDVIVDNYFLIVEDLGKRIEERWNAR